MWRPSRHQEEAAAVTRIPLLACALLVSTGACWAEVAVHLLPVEIADDLPAELRRYRERLSTDFWQAALAEDLTRRWPEFRVLPGPPDRPSPRAEVFLLRGRLEVLPARQQVPLLHLSGLRGARWEARRLAVVEARGWLRYTFTLVEAASDAVYCTAVWNVAWTAPPPPDDRYLVPPGTAAAAGVAVLTVPDNVFHGEWSPEASEGHWPPPGLDDLPDRIRRRRTPAFGRLLPDPTPLRIEGLADADHQPLPAGLPLRITTRYGRFIGPAGSGDEHLVGAGADPLSVEGYRPPPCSTAVTDVLTIRPAEPSDSPGLEILSVNTACLESWVAFEIDSRRVRPGTRTVPLPGCPPQPAVTFSELRRARLILALGPQRKAETVTSGHVFRTFPITGAWWTGTEFFRQRSSIRDVLCPGRVFQRERCRLRAAGRLAPLDPSQADSPLEVLVVTEGDGTGRVLEIRPPQWKTALEWSGTAVCNEERPEDPFEPLVSRRGDLNAAELLAIGPDAALSTAAIESNAECWKAAGPLTAAATRGGCRGEALRQGIEIVTRFTWTLHLP